MNILLASSEVSPFAKTGGLADVCGSLPIALRRLGHEVVVFLPAYRCVREVGVDIDWTDIQFDIPIGGRIVGGRLLKCRLPDSDVPVYLVEHPGYYERDELYRAAGEDYPDNCERFVFFCRAVLESVRLLNLDIDVVHANDWQTGLLPAFLNIEYAHTPGYESIGSVFTIHNMAYQGVFSRDHMPLTGLDWKYFNWQQLEYYDQINLLKAGMVFADAVTTVSPNYAEEIQTSPHGCGLEGVLSRRRDSLEGIINGVDYDVWNPEIDSHVARNYGTADWREGKAACKAALQLELGLPVSPETPLLGLVGRLADQKGWTLLAEIIERWADSENVQWAVLGAGEPNFHTLLSALAGRRPDRVAARLTFSNALAHQIEAGADMFLMPSRFEPCGLNQLYSLRYGTVPVVRRTGGLADTVTDASPEHLAAGRATGFVFGDYSVDCLERALHRALDVFHQQPDTWSQLVNTGMQQDWSWTESARRYGELYEKVATFKK